jgi:hypothetical protein
MWDLPPFREVTGCRTPGDHGSRRCDELTVAECSPDRQTIGIRPVRPELGKHDPPLPSERRVDLLREGTAEHPASRAG